MNFTEAVYLKEAAALFDGYSSVVRSRNCPLPYKRGVCGSCLQKWPMRFFSAMWFEFVHSCRGSGFASWGLLVSAWMGQRCYPGPQYVEPTTVLRMDLPLLTLKNFGTLEQSTMAQLRKGWALEIRVAPTDIFAVLTRASTHRRSNPWNSDRNHLSAAVRSWCSPSALLLSYQSRL